MTKEIYLDNSATTPLKNQVRAAMEPFWQREFGNPSSPHRKGTLVQQVLQKCRRFLGQSFAFQDGQLIFTGSGTEANNLAILGIAQTQHQPGHLITSAVEHPSVLGPVEALMEQGWEADLLPVDSTGMVDIASVEQALRPDTRLVSIMAVNNELGTIQPIEQIGALLSKVNRERRQPILLHCDAVQAVGKISLPGQLLDLLTVSAHKLGGPKGVGLLCARRGLRLHPLIFGGGQEGGLRSGTQNVPGIVGLAKAVELALTTQRTNEATLKERRSQLYQGLSGIPGFFLNGTLESSAPHILNVGFSGVRAEVLLHYLEQKGIYVGIGAACSTNKKGVSHVLKAIGRSEAEARSSIRLSLSPDLTKEDIELTIKEVQNSIEEIRAIYGGN